MEHFQNPIPKVERNEKQKILHYLNGTLSKSNTKSRKK
jgi:hypothetical protein